MIQDIKEQFRSEFREPHKCDKTLQRIENKGEKPFRNEDLIKRNKWINFTDKTYVREL